MSTQMVIPYEIDWFYLTHPHLLDGDGIVEVFGGLIMILSITEFATVGAALLFAAAVVAGRGVLKP